MTDELVDLATVRHYLGGISERTVRRNVQLRGMPCRRVSARVVMYSLAEVSEWTRRHERVVPDVPLPGVRRKGKRKIDLNMHFFVV